MLLAALAARDELIRQEMIGGETFAQEIARMVAAAPTLADAARMGLLKDGMQPNDPDVQGPLDRETR